MRNKTPIGEDGFPDPDDGTGLSLSPPGSVPPDGSGLLPSVGDLGVTFQSPAPPQGASTGGALGSSPGPVTGSSSPFVINVIYDSSVNSAPAGFKTGIQTAVSFLESVITTPVTVNIDVGYGEIEGQALEADALGESQTFLNTYSYASIKSALGNVDPAAAANLPVNAPGSMWLSTAEAKALGLAGASTDIDGFAGFGSSFPFTYDPNNRSVAGEYDFIGVVEHEFTEVMGRIDLFGATLSGGGQNFTNTYSLLDLYHYTSPGVHTFTGTSSNYFSINNGTSNLDNFNSNPSGDLGDWAGNAGNDSFLAFSPSGEADLVSPTDVKVMNALGFATGATFSVTTTTLLALQGGAAIALLSGAPTITDPATTLTGATVRIANGSGTAVTGDRLFVAGVQSGTVSGLTVSWNATTSTLTLSGSASLATYEAVLSQVTYQDTGTDGSSGAHPVRTVTWSVNDGTQTLSATSQVTVDRAPTATNESGFAVAGTTLTVAAANGALSGDSDLDRDALAVTTVNGVAVGAGGTTVAGSFGHLTLNPDGSYSYVANGGVAAGSQDSFNIGVGDGNGGSAASTLQVTIDNALVTAPQAILTPSGKATPSTWTLTGSGGNGSLTFGLASSATHGTAVVNANGTFTYTPAAGYQGGDSFQYRVTDGLGETSVNTVSVGVGNAGYQVAQSLQLTAAQSQYLMQTPAAAGSQTTWTWSGWLDMSSVTPRMVLFSTQSGNGAGEELASLRISPNGQLEFYDYSYTSSGFITNAHLETSQSFAANTWDQVTLVYDSTQAVAANRLELFVNGQQITSLAALTDPTQNFAGVTGSSALRYVGAESGSFTLNGNLADAQFIDGQALGPTALGTLVNGQWEPAGYTGSYGTNGYHLTFASGSIGTDVSGNGDNFTPVNLSNANVSSASPGGTGLRVALTLDNGVAFNNGSGDAISGASVRLTGGFANDADLVSANTSGTGITAAWDASSETLTLIGTDTAAHYQALLDNLVFSSGASDPTNGGLATTRTATWQVTDATNNQLSAAQSETIDISPSFAPIGIAVAGATTTLLALQGGAAIALLSGAPTITDPATTLTGATVRIANGSGTAVTGDRLFVAGVQSGTVSGLTVSWNATTSTLTLSGSASLATYEAVLSQVTYQDTGTDGSSGAHPVRTVTWSVNDGTQTLSATSQVTVDRAPTATNESGFAVAGTTLTVAAANGALSGDSDLDRDALAVTTVNGVAVGAGGTTVAGSFGHLTLNPDGSYSYVANGGVAAGSQDSFNIGVGDGNGGSAASTLQVTIDNALVTAPQAILTPSGKATPSTWTLTGSGGNGSLTFGLASSATHGTAVVNANGTFTYTPAAGYQGGDSFQYRVTDGLGETSVNTVSVGVGNAGYQVAQSLQLTAAQSQYLMQTPAAAGSQTTWTWSGWLDMSSVTPRMVLFSTQSGNGAGEELASLRISPNGQLEFYDYSYTSSGFITNAHLETSQSFAANTWDQVTLVYDSTQAVAANRLELFVNGQQITSLAALTDPTQNFAGVTGSSALRYVGAESGSFTLNGNLADAQFIDGQALGPTALGTLVNGQWEPAGYTGSYGTNGYHLTFASGSIGTDVSGNGDNFTPVNLSNANVSSASPGGTGLRVALTLDNGVAFNNGSGDAISGASVRLTGGFANDADLVSANTSGTGITAAWDASSETLTLIGTDTAAHYQALLDNLVFSSGASDPTNGGLATTRTATWQVTDATNNQLSAAQSETIDISPSFAPIGIAVAGATTTLLALQGGAAIALLSGAPTITDPATTLTGATVRIANGSGTAVTGDRLFVAGVQSGTVSGLTVSWNATTSTLTLSGSASLATYEAVLSQVTYQDTGTDGSSGAHPVRTVTWSVNDGTQTLSATSQVTVDRAPTATNESGFAVAGTTLTVAAANGALSGDSDLDRDALAVTTVNGVAVGAGGTTVAGSFGHLTLNPDGSYSYVANGGVAAGSQDSFNIGVGDGNGGSAASTLQVTIDNALVTAPQAILTPSGKATPSTWTLTGSGGNGSLTFGLASSATHGTAVVNANGTFTYTPAAGYQGGDSFQYRVTDGLGETSVNTVSVGVGNAGYQVAQSLQLTAAQSQYLMQTPAAAGSQTTWTWSGWLDMSSVTPRMVLFSTQSGNGAGEELASLRISPNGQLEFYDYSYTSSGFITNAHLETSQSFAANTWDQVTLVYDSTQAVAANRLELFVNGQQITSLAALTDPTQNFAGVTGSSALRYVGAESGSFTLNGNLADAQFIDGQALGPTALGTLVNGQWEPAGYTGSYGTNGYHLTFASGSIGTDVSGNGDNFTPVNLSNANVSSASPGGTGLRVALTLDNGVAFNNGSGDAISGASVRLTGGFANDADLVSANTSGTGITAAWDASSETLTLIGTDTAAHYQALLDNLVFSSGASDPTNGGLATTRTATWQVTDATNNQLSAAQSETIDISPSFAPNAALAGQLVENTASQDAGAVTIADGGSVELVYSAAAVSFIGSSGTLQLDNSTGFNGQIVGFSGEDQIDLRDIVFSPQTTVGYAAEPATTGGSLTVGDGSEGTNLVMVGNYAASQFAISSDGRAGTLVTLQPTLPTGNISLGTPQKHA